MLETIVLGEDKFPSSDTVEVSFSLRIHELLAPFDLQQQTSYRNFRLLVCYHSIQSLIHFKFH